MIIDTHCHYNLSPLSHDLSGHWKKAKKNGIEKSIVVGTNIETSKLALDIAKKFPNLYASIGLHPGNYSQEIKNLLDGDKYSQTEIDELVEAQLLAIKKIIEAESNNPKLIAYGEIGLDYYRLKNKGLKRNLVIEMQKKSFEAQLKLAFENNLVAILHVRDQDDRFENKDNAYFDTLEILKKVLNETGSDSGTLTQASSTPKLILHCASGPISYIKEALSMGAYIGVAGNITYDSADDIREIVKLAPPEKLLLETDAPYLVPASLKNQSIEAQICEPFMIKATASYLEKKMGIDLDIILDNTNNLFKNKFN
jgi:TatD DNase family protein